MKAEVLEKLKDIDYTFDWITYEGDRYATETKSFQLESDNYFIDLEIEITVIFESHEEYTEEKLDLIDFQIFDKEGCVLVDSDNLEKHFKISEITDNLNISI